MAESSKSRQSGKSTRKERKKPESFKEKRARRQPDPVEMKLTMVVNFGDEPDETVTVFDDRDMKMFGSVLKNRDKILRHFVFNLARAGLMSPKVARELAPSLMGALALRRGNRKQDKDE